jgi:hypothetical protein
MQLQRQTSPSEGSTHTLLLWRLALLVYKMYARARQRDFLSLLAVWRRAEVSATAGG